MHDNDPLMEETLHQQGVHRPLASATGLEKRLRTLNTYSETIFFLFLQGKRILISITMIMK